jgi:hypothetical protein
MLPMPSSNISPAENLLIDLVHDLRQYLGNIETSAYCLNLLVDSAPPRAQGYLTTIEQQVASAERRLSEAGAAITRLRPQPAEPVDILVRTNSSISIVT